MPIEKVTVEAIHDWRIRLQKRGRSSGGPRASPKVSQEKTLSAKTRRNAHSRLSRGLGLMVKMGATCPGTRPWAWGPGDPSASASSRSALPISRH